MKYLTKKDLNTDENVFDLGRYQPGDPSTTDRLMILRSTSGTSGTPTILVREALDDLENHLFWRRDDEGLMRCNPNHSIGLIFVLEHFYNCNAKRNRALYLSPQDIKGTHLKEIMEEYQPTFVHGTPSLIGKMIQRLGDAAALVLQTLTQALMSGELPSKTYTRWFNTQLPHTDLVHAYTVTEIGLSGTGCPTLTTVALAEDLTCSKVHPVESYEYDILHKDENGIGEIVLTKKGVGSYCTGDMGRLERTKCSCGEDEILTIYGRYEFDLIHCLGATFYSSHLEAIFSELASYVTDFFAEVRELHTTVDSMGELTIKIVPTAKLRALGSPEQFIADQVSRNLQVTKTRTLGALVQDRIFHPPVILLVDKLPQMSKKIYLKKVYD